MIALEYEEGRVFLSGPHPEWEEDSDRDGQAWPDGFDDDGSEWNMMLAVSLWLTESDSSTTWARGCGLFTGLHGQAA